MGASEGASHHENPPSINEAGTAAASGCSKAGPPILGSSTAAVGVGAALAPHNARGVRESGLVWFSLYSVRLVGGELDPSFSWAIAPEI
jgi:hypothetical protein